MDQSANSYSFRVKLDLPYGEALERVKAALKSEGFGILTEIDVRKTFKDKLDVDFAPYAILGACNPPLAYQALKANPEIGLFLPCNVIVYDQDGGTMVSIINPLSMLELARTPELESVAQDAYSRLQRVAKDLGH